MRARSTLEPRRLLHTERGLFVIDKPAGLAATGRTLEDPASAQHQLGRLLGHPVWAVHQLDTQTSGLLIFVARPSLVAPWQARLSRASKRYVAICHGAPAWAHRRMKAPLSYDEGLRRWVVREGGKKAFSILRRRAVARDHAEIEVELRTGRTHQARVHLAHSGHPLVGERRYREPPCEVHPRHALHAARLRFDEGPVAELEAPLPPDLEALRHRLGLA